MGGNCYTINWRKLLVSIRLGSDWYHYSYTFIRCWRRCFVSFPASNLNLLVSPRGSNSTLITQSSRRAFERQSENNVLRSYARILSRAWNDVVPRAFVITRSRWEPARWLFNTWPSINFYQCFTVKIKDFPCQLRGFFGFIFSGVLTWPDCGCNIYKPRSRVVCKKCLRTEVSVHIVHMERGNKGFGNLWLW